MGEGSRHLNLAEEASDRALSQVYQCLRRQQSFLVEAGAGAGKTFTLIRALCFLLERNRYLLQKRHQKIACITFTNVAKDEIRARTDDSPVIHCDTIHGFSWSLIRRFQPQMKQRLSECKRLFEKVGDVRDIGDRTVRYDLGYRGMDDSSVSIHHDDVLVLTSALMKNFKFRRLLAGRYPIILIDEYQDTNADWMKSIIDLFLGQKGSPLFGFFGDHWQKIYGAGCGRIEHPCLRIIRKEANFRSAAVVVACLNRMRSELPQFAADARTKGSVRIFHTNSWNGQRMKGAHWSGDLPDEAAQEALESVRRRLGEEGWDLSSGDTKILMLTHRALAVKQGYPTVPSVFRYNESFTKKEDPHVAYFADVLEPGCRAYVAKRYGEMFGVLGLGVPVLRSHSEKVEWSEAMEKVIELRETGTVGEVIDHMLSCHGPVVPDVVERRERKLRALASGIGGELARGMLELKKLRKIPYREIVALCRYLSGHSPFETKHGVKGAEFENVLVVIGRGWSRYNFGKMLELGMSEHVPAKERRAFVRNRNLFYVTCSRPKRRLAVLFTQELSIRAMETVRKWFGEDAIEAVRVDG